VTFKDVLLRNTKYTKGKRGEGKEENEEYGLCP
jgi:hypothetical protein